LTIADSDVLIDSLRGSGKASARVALELQQRSLATTVISVFELLTGARTTRERDKVERLLGAIAVLPLDEPASREAARVGRELKAQGATIGPADLLIAGICLARSGVLLTRNRAHFDHVPGLRLGDLSRE